MNGSTRPTPFMSEALRLARRGRGTTAPNPMVGAVVESKGRAVGRGYHRVAGGPHAEVLALDEAGEKARGATLHVTLEPCCHQGRTGPCTERILAAGVAAVNVAIEDPFPAVAGKGMARLRDAGVEVRVGDGEAEARSLNEAYLLRVARGRPWVDLKLASTLDGKIADRSGASRWTSGEAARARVHEIRWGADAVLVGVGTVLADDPKLTARRGKGEREPLRVVLDSTLRTPPAAHVLEANRPGRVVVVCRRGAPADRRKALEAAGARVWPVSVRRGGGVDLAAVLGRLAAEGVNRLLVEGGAGVAGTFLAEDLVDRLHLFLAPAVLGAGRDAFAGLGALPLARAVRFREVRTTRHGEDREVVLEREA